MAFKLIEAAQSRWWSINVPHLVALVRAGAKFEKGVLIERTAKKYQEAPRNQRKKPIHRS